MPSLDKADWVVCYRAWERPLYNVVYRIVWDAAESQDIVQDAFLRCWRKRDHIHAHGFKTLIFKTAMNLARSRRRRDRLWRLTGLDSPDVELTSDAGHGSMVPKPVRDAIDGLPRHLRDALLLAELAGMTYAEIAATLGIKEGTVGSRRARALEILRRRLPTEGGR